MNTVSILIIATAHALLGGTGAQTGLWLEELKARASQLRLCPAAGFLLIRIL